ncbi:hypothetical protein GL50803_009336 [Giardia duodenalis]|uniref:Uncharacterized protein n=1 Tax=Giardia intestinalis (strain ATCC 50803 / WB clone C6) TaxID=184922 RepID=D3KHZ6_GIAIC|nr:hypothetical protein GL50803_009336 [Giardia intestinalis]KAE8305931.1 hypothetical protein GL50803_009336 [Giardia intestinalis]
MLLISPGVLCIDQDKMCTLPTLAKSNDMVQCAASFQTYTMTHCPELSWRWILVTASGQDKSYNGASSDHVITLKTSAENTQDPSAINVSSHGSIILNHLDNLFAQDTIPTRPSFIILLESSGRPISLAFLSDCRDFLAERAVPYWLSCPLESLFTKSTDDSDELAYRLKGDAALVLRHMNIVSVTEESLAVVADSWADDTGENRESKLRLCLSLITPGERSAVLYVSKDMLGICFGEPDSEEATVKLVPCLFEASGGYSSITPVEMLIRFCALLERGMNFQTALASIVAQV